VLAEFDSGETCDSKSRKQHARSQPRLSLLKRSSCGLDECLA
jgi:hypothetical protein